MISYYKRSLKDKKLGKIEKFQKGCWINVTDPTEEELYYLSNAYNLDKQNLLSGIDANEVPRVEFDEKDIYVIVKVISEDNLPLDTCLILLSENFIMTLSKKETLFVKTILEKKVKIITTQKLKTLITFLSVIGDEFERETIKTVKIVNAKKSSTKEMRDKDLEILLQQEERLSYFISSYAYTKHIYDRLIKKLKFYEEDKEIMEDLIIESNQGLNLCKSSLKTISNLRNYQTILLSNKTSRTITILTIFTIFFSISTTISGFYGMNVLLPEQDNPYAFFYIVLATLFVGLLMLGYFLKTRI